MNLGQLRAGLSDRGYGTDTAAVQNDLINAAIRRVHAEKRWPWMEKTSTSVTTAVGNPVLQSMPADYLVPEAVRISFSPTEEYELCYIRPQELREKRLNDPTPDTPVYWSEYAGTIQLYPIPERVYTVTLDYIATLTDLANDGDPAPGPAQFHDIYIWGAISAVAFRQRDSAGHQLAEGMFTNRLMALRNFYAVRQRQTTVGVKESGYYDEIG